MTTDPVKRLDVLKALGDNTRYAIYLEIARASRPLATAEIAETLGLHPNSVRPHLERMRDVGLLDQHTVNDGGVGRPHHRFSLASDAPSLGLEPPAAVSLAAMLLDVAAASGADNVDAREAGSGQGVRDAARYPASTDVLSALVGELDRMGFDPQVVADADADNVVTIGFAHCPFAESARANPEVVCGLHQGLIEGLVSARGGCRVTEFCTLVDREPCQVNLELV
ncbi:MAG: helix-turn-helix domain-containing protein [Acidobacteria bacterium]|nr:helix-turn-helix domain-containing protein [Acidobacteriota bacterium]